MNQLKELIEKCESITYEEINTQIKNNYNSISYVKKITKEKNIELDKFIETIDEIDIFFINNVITYDIQFEKGKLLTARVAGKIINNNYPEKMNVDIYYKYGQNCGKKGRKMFFIF